MERAFGIFNRRIKSARFPGVNAGNAVELVSAHQYLKWEKDKFLDFGEDTEESSEEIGESNLSSSAPEIWGPHHKAATVNGICNEINLMVYLRNYWSRQRNLKPNQLPALRQDITVGKRLYKDGSTYECSLLSRSTTGRGSFIKVLLQVDEKAHHTNVQ